MSAGSSNSETDMLAYAKAAAEALRLPLDEAQARRVAAHLAVTAALARQLEEAPLGPGDEPAQVYCPAPFPSPVPGEAMP